MIIVREKLFGRYSSENKRKAMIDAIVSQGILNKQQAAELVDSKNAEKRNEAINKKLGKTDADYNNKKSTAESLFKDSFDDYANKTPYSVDPKTGKKIYYNTDASAKELNSRVDEMEKRFKNLSPKEKRELGYGDLVDAESDFNKLDKHRSKLKNSKDYNSLPVKDYEGEISKENRIAFRKKYGHDPSGKNGVTRSDKIYNEAFWDLYESRENANLAAGRNSKGKVANKFTSKRNIQKAHGYDPTYFNTAKDVDGEFVPRGIDDSFMSDKLKSKIGAYNKKKSDQERVKLENERQARLKAQKELVERMEELRKEEEAKKAAEKEAQKQAEAKAKQEAELAAKKQAEEAAKKQAEETARKQAEEARLKAEMDAKAKAAKTNTQSPAPAQQQPTQTPVQDQKIQQAHTQSQQPAGTQPHASGNPGNAAPTNTGHTPASAGTAGTGGSPINTTGVKNGVKGGFKNHFKRNWGWYAGGAAAATGLGLMAYNHYKNKQNEDAAQNQGQYGYR